MMPFSRRTILFIALFSAAASGGGAYFVFDRKDRIFRDRESTGSVVVARKYIRPGQRIDVAQLEEIKMPVAYVQPTAFERISDFRDSAGRSSFAARIGLLKGEQVLRSKVVDEASRRDLAWTLEPRRLGVTLSLDSEAAAGGLLKPGDWVAVLAVLDPQPGLTEARADIIESHVAVSAINGRISAADEENREKFSGRNISNESILVTLSLTSHQANRILLARSRGRVTLALRSAVDDGSPLSGSVRLSDLR